MFVNIRAIQFIRDICLSEIVNDTEENKLIIILKLLNKITNDLYY